MTDLDLGRINSATKYPSIPTYHAMDARGILLEEPMAFHGPVYLTEKIDGANGRIIRLPTGDWLIGSREELYTARGDRVFNTNLGIVEALRPVAESLNGIVLDKIMVFFLEVYGAGVGHAMKQYSSSGAVGHRMFDLAFAPMDVLGWPREKIASWREEGGQSWATADLLEAAAAAEGIAITPRLGLVPATALPTTVADTLTWLEETLPQTQAALDEGAGKRPEGIVLRSPDRKVIAKARFHNYRRTIGARQK